LGEHLCDGVNEETLRAGAVVRRQQMERRNYSAVAHYYLKFVPEATDEGVSIFLTRA